MADKNSSGKLQIKKRVKGGVIYTNGMIRIDKCILSYPHVDAPYAGEDGGEPAYGVVGLLDKEAHSGIIEEMRNICKSIMDEKKTKVSADKLFIKDGDRYFEHKDECKGRYVVSAREKTRPVLRNANNVKLDPKEDMDEIKEIFYGGAIASLLINPWYQDNKFGKRINANIKTVRFVEDGTPFGEGRIDDDDAWDDDDYNNGGDSDWDEGSSSDDDI